MSMLADGAGREKSAGAPSRVLLGPRWDSAVPVSKHSEAGRPPSPVL
jgi:hypothetical protein